LFDKNGDYPIPPASLTKLMTMHLVQKEIEGGRFSLHQLIDVPAEAYWKNLPSDSSLMFLEPGQLVTVKELLLGLAVSSGNDAAIAAAILVADGVEQFVAEMNSESAGLGFPLIRFADASGLDPASCITAGQFVEVCRFDITAHPGSLDLFHSAEQFTYPGVDNLPGTFFVKSITTKNRNLLIHSYQGVDGLKSGFIEESGYNVALTAVRNGRRLVAVLLGGSGSNHTEGKELLAADGKLLLDYGFDQYTHLIPQGIDYGTVRVWKGKKDEVGAAPGEEVLLCIRRDDIQDITYTIDLAEYLIAPIPAGKRLGTLTVSLHGKVLSETPIVSQTAVDRAGPVKRLFHSIRLFLQRKTK
jgi:serine-type D-Ala-D-Ala carboxypeptidase (penicillin-binding protein 5/6)